MLMEVRNNLRFILISLKYNLKSALEYKKSFIIQTIFMIVNNLFFLVYWIVVFSINDGNLNGLVMKDILLLWSIPTGAWGLSNFLFRGLREIDSLVISGGLDTYLLQPKNMIINIATSKSDFGACGDLLYGLVIGLIACDGLGEYLQILMYIIIGSIIFMSCFILIRCFSIWIGDMTNISRIYEQSLIITLCTYPYDIFGKSVKILMFTILPAAYITHMPIKLLNNFDIKIFGLILIVTTIYMIFSIKFFYYILKKYESGNNISMKE